MIAQNCPVHELWLRCLFSAAAGEDYVIYPVPKWKQLGACHLNSQVPGGSWMCWELGTLAGYMQAEDCWQESGFDHNRVIGHGQCTVPSFQTLRVRFLAHAFLCRTNLTRLWASYVPDIIIIKVICAEENLNETWRAITFSQIIQAAAIKIFRQWHPSAFVQPGCGGNTCYFSDYESTVYCETVTPPGSSLGN